MFSEIYFTYYSFAISFFILYTFVLNMIGKQKKFTLFHFLSCSFNIFSCRGVNNKI